MDKMTTWIKTSLSLLVLYTVIGFYPFEFEADAMILNPKSVVFTGTVGMPPPPPQYLNLEPEKSSNGNTWSVTADVPWLQVSPTAGISPSEVSLLVTTSGLSPGVYFGDVLFSEDAGTDNPQIAHVTLVLNANWPVKVATWKDAHKGAVSISTDDGKLSCIDQLTQNSYNGTYFLPNINQPSYFADLYHAGIELGGHTVNHSCWGHISAEVYRTQEIEPNIQGICSLPIFCSDIVSLAWPCGTTYPDWQAVTSDYFLSARGYNMNQLEDPTPANFQNLRSFNSHEHFPFPPEDLKTVVDMAELQGKWAILVFHDFCNDNGAINHAASKDVWVAPIGTVVKYILQRDRFILTNFNEVSNRLSFSVSRIEVAPSPVRSFETAFGSNDVVTLLVDIDDLRPVDEVRVNGIIHPYQLKTDDGNVMLQLNTLLFVTSTSVEIFYKNPEISLNPTSLNFSMVEGSAPSNQTIAVSNSGGGSLSWTALADSALPAWLSVSPASGTGNASLTVSVNASGLLPGIYSKSITVSAPGATNTLA